jgi:hypothetical protein
MSWTPPVHSSVIVTFRALSASVIVNGWSTWSLGPPVPPD